MSSFVTNGGGERSLRSPGASEDRQDFVQFLSRLLATDTVEGELRDFVRATLSEEDRFRQWQGVLEVLERGSKSGLFARIGQRKVRGVEHFDFVEMATRRMICVPYPPVRAVAIVPRWTGRSFRLPVPLPTSEESLADSLQRFLEEEVRTRLGADLAVVYLERTGKGPEYIASARGEGFTLPSRFLPAHVDRWTLGRGLAVVADDLRRDPELARWSQRGTFRSVSVVPLTGQDGGRPVGVLEVWSRRPSFFAEEELGHLVSFGHFLADISMNALYLKEQIFRDDLTGVFNRRYFDQVLLDTEMLRSRRTGREFALLLADVDNFKLINDRYGHSVGDRILRQVALLLSDKVRPHVDIVSRYGGEEFAVLLPELGSGPHGARVVAERLRAEVKAFQFSLICAQVTGPVTISLGGALYRGNPETSEKTRMLEKQQLIDHADAALLQAKRDSKDCCRIWGDDHILPTPGMARGSQAPPLPSGVRKPDVEDFEESSRV